MQISWKFVICEYAQRPELLPLVGLGVLISPITSPYTKQPRICLRMALSEPNCGNINISRVNKFDPNTVLELCNASRNVPAIKTVNIDFGEIIQPYSGTRKLSGESILNVYCIHCRDSFQRLSVHHSLKLQSKLPGVYPMKIQIWRNVNTELWITLIYLT